ncbi:HAD family hydrolase [Streptomyces rishiriensis]|uniref:FMN phosphatase YigB (HAD superfamily) n=1 Tax=Streptomyces rishiriensis TaxID=68264 RepID=A0ABU0NGV4_STRRH|nr:HAD family phosphatase [Streptomyces rishiriensis]MDQ0577988.1 FMN phosphatase YigB (HAD superfamily) [Streptomyces rishiriensis]
MSPQHLVLDLGGVLFHFDHAHRLQRLADAFALPADRLDVLLWGSGFSADCDSGKYPHAAEVRERIRAATDFTGSEDDLDAAWCSAFRPDHAVRETLERHRGSRSLALFTNNGPLEQEALLRLYPTMFYGFDHLLFSHRLGHRKPTLAAFDAAAKQLGAYPDDILFIDDSATNTDAARAAGWTALHFQSRETLERALRPRIQ